MQVSINKPISARDSIEDKVLGLEQGADDYLPKPFHLAELFRIISESGTAAGVRRIEAVTGEGAIATVEEQQAAETGLHVLY